MMKNEVEQPKLAPKGRMESGYGCDEFKGQAMDIAYGQAGVKGCASDQRKIQAQALKYVDDSNSEY